VIPRRSAALFGTVIQQTDGNPVKYLDALLAVPLVSLLIGPLHAEMPVYDAAASSASAALAPATETSSAPLVEVSSAPAVVEEPFIWPVGGAKPKIASGFGKRQAPAVKGAARKTEMHEGVDLRVAPGAAVHAAQSGKVLFAGFSKMYVSRADKKEQSRFLILRHADGKSTRYVHLNVLKVRPGQEVQAGEVIATASESDEWQEPVLHFELRDPSGKALNPAKFVVKDVPPL
jgi:murein DD-endopeptidase MepM/ murein hydrolase activator NlpD